MTTDLTKILAPWRINALWVWQIRELIPRNTFRRVLLWPGLILALVGVSILTVGHWP